MSNVTPTPRRLRDVADVEQYVRDAVDQLAPAALGRPEALHAHGVRAVMRVERALPPGVPLEPVLDEVLPRRLVALMQALRGSAQPVAAVA